MTYEIAVLPEAENDLDSLDEQQFDRLMNKLDEIVLNPLIPSKKLRKFTRCYKIRIGEIRAIYQVNIKTKEIILVAVGKREDSEAYKKAKKRVKD